MFADYVYEKSAAEYSNRILLIDADHLTDDTHFTDGFLSRGFEIITYHDDLSFRMEYEERIKSDEGRIAVVARPEQYIPYDLRRRLTVYVVSLADLFPRLEPSVLRENGTDYDLVSAAYTQTYDQYKTPEATQLFLRSRAYSYENIKDNLMTSYQKLLERSSGCTSYKEWFAIASEKARIDVLSICHEIELDTSEINYRFRDYIFGAYKKLSTCMDAESPVLVSRAMEYMHDHSERFVIVVMDGMAEFDWNILSSSFEGIHYEATAAFAMIPTVTSVSRQCLLSNKYPSQLISLWSQSKEKQEFVECARSMGFSDKQISYQRGYDADFGSLIRCGAVIINDIDDMVHGQKQGRIGMYNDVGVMAKQRKLVNMTRRFLSAGFDVYITADHGNTPRRGMGKLMTSGVETETKSRCMLVLKDFADKEGTKEKYGLLEFPKTYLPKEYDYLICDVGDSFDAKGEEVMSHGGISIDECIVPFIKIKAGENNG